MMIAPKRAEIIDTIINVNVHPSSPAASVMKCFCFHKNEYTNKEKRKEIQQILEMFDNHRGYRLYFLI